MSTEQLTKIKQLLSEAETAHRSGQDWEAMALYDRAIDLAQQSKNFEEGSLAHEMAAQFWLDKGKADFAAVHLKRAYQGYLHSQANDKITELEYKYALLLADTPTSQGVPSIVQAGYAPTLDLATVTAVSQSLAGEIMLEKLMAKLVRAIIDYVGAEQLFFILDKAGQWVIEAQGALQGELRIFQSSPIQAGPAEPLLPISIIDYVAQTQATLILSEAAQATQFAQDPYLRARQPRSILCAPFLTQIKSSGILYLEDNRTSDAFSPDKLEILAWLASQAVIAIETAILYATLESALENQAGLTNAYSRFVPREILQFLGKDKITQVTLGDQTQREMTLLFSDIRSFATLSEQMTPQENFNFINAYLGRVSPIIRQYNGFIDKYIGDAIMALFQGPADEAVQAAIEMQQEVTRYNQELDQGLPIRIGIGLHRGSVMFGTVGEVRRMEGTVISDAVNLASRLEGLTKMYGASIVVSEQTLFSLQRPAQYNFRFLDKVKVKGKKDQVSVFEIFDGDPQELITLKLKTRTDFEKGLLHYHSQEFREAINYFNNVLEINPQDRAAQVYLRQATYCLWIGWEKVKALTEQ